MTSPRPARQRRSTFRGARAAAVLTSVLLAGAAAPAVAADPTDPGVLAPAGAGGTAVARQRLTADPATFEAGTYVVVLRDPAAADYRGGIAGLRPTTGKVGFSARSARTAAYTAHLAAAQRQVATSAGVTPLASYSLATNGFAAHLSAKQAARLATDPRVRQVVESELVPLQDATTSTGYLGLEGDDGVWASIGGPAEAGRGVVVGVIDTGIAPENPSFAGDPLGTTDGAAPFRDGGAIVFHKSDGTDFRGTCQDGEQFTDADCTQKIVGARYFVAGFGTDHLGDASVGEYVSPRDGDSHGSHTASTAAGELDVATTDGPRVSGVTPAARIAAYKACWSGRDAASDHDDGCASPDLLSAIDAAVADNVDVINYSIGGGAAETTNSLTDQAFKAAAAAGIFVAAAGGNSGPAASTLDNAAPWVTTVAATTFPAPEATVELGNGDAAVGASVTVPAAGVAGRFVEAADVALAGASTPAQCGPGTLDPARAAGAVVLCDRGVVGRTEKSAEVARAGGVGMVLANAVPDSTDVDAHAVPTVHVDAPYAAALHEYAGSAGATVTLVPGNSSGDPSAATPQVAGFSSRGPVEADGSDLVKPDLAAPGVNVLAAFANGAGAAPHWGYMSGTSMASPHVAGLAALYLGTKPDATPAEIKSALMTSATDTVDADGAPAEDPFAQGNGQVAARRYLDPGLVYLNDPEDWESYLAGIGEPTAGDVEPIDGSDLNLASIGIGSLPGRQSVTRTVTATRPGTYAAEVTGLPGIRATVEPATLDFAEAGEQHSFTVTFLREDAPLEEFSTGYLTWSDGDTAVRSSLAVRPVAFDAPDEIAGTGTTGTAELTAQVGDDASVVLAAEGLAHGSSVSGTGTAGGRTHRYAVTVPEGASFARFDLDAADDTGDLDLYVYRVDEASQNTWFVEGSVGDRPDERVDLVAPVPGTYVVEAVFYRAGATAELDYTMTSYVVDPSGGAGDFAVAPDALEAQVGDTPTVTASWADLAPGRYLGVVRFGDTGARTLVAVDAGDDVPVGPGTPALTLSPDASGWVARNGDLRVSATGLTPGAAYTAAAGDTVLRSGRASAEGRLDWMVPMTADVPAGPNTLTLTGPGATLDAPFRLTPVGVTGASTFPWTALNGKVFTRVEIAYAGYGDLRYRLQSADGSHVYTEQTVHLDAVPGITVWTYTGPWIPVGQEDVVAVITPLLPDGGDGPVFTSTPATSDVVEPGSVTFAPTARDPDDVQVTVDNRNPYSSYPVMARYRGCDGRAVVGWDFFPLGTTTRTWDLTGFTGVEVVDQFGQTLATYAHQGPGRCDAAGVSIAQDYWATLTATPTADAGYDPARPITLELSNRYAPHSSGFSLAIGEGATRNAEKPFYEERIPVEQVDERGPVVRRSVTVRPGVPHWAASDWEEYVDPILYFQTAWLEIPALTLADLTPGTGTPTPEQPVIGAGAVVVRGRAVQGRTLHAEAGTWTPGGVALTHQWLRDGAPIPGATGPDRRLTRADAGHALTVRVTGALAGADPVSRTSTAVTVLHRFRATPRPRLVGRAAVRHTLTVRTGTWTPRPARLRVTWLRDGEVIRGAHGLRHRLTVADRGHRITVTVTARRPGYDAVSRTSRAVRVR